MQPFAREEKIRRKWCDRFYGGYFGRKQKLGSEKSVKAQCSVSMNFSKEKRSRAQSSKKTKKRSERCMGSVPTNVFSLHAVHSHIFSETIRSCLHAEVLSFMEFWVGIDMNWVLEVIHHTKMVCRNDSRTISERTKVKIKSKHSVCVARVVIEPNWYWELHGD